MNEQESRNIVAFMRYYKYLSTTESNRLFILKVLYPFYFVPATLLLVYVVRNKAVNHYSLLFGTSFFFQLISFYSSMASFKLLEFHAALISRTCVLYTILFFFGGVGVPLVERTNRKLRKLIFWTITLNNTILTHATLYEMYDTSSNSFDTLINIVVFLLSPITYVLYVLITVFSFFAYKKTRAVVENTPLISCYSYKRYFIILALGTVYDLTILTILFLLVYKNPDPNEPEGISRLSLVACLEYCLRFTTLLPSMFFLATTTAGSKAFCRMSDSSIL